MCTMSLVVTVLASGQTASLSGLVVEIFYLQTLSIQKRQNAPQSRVKVTGQKTAG